MIQFLIIETVKKFFFYQKELFSPEIILGKVAKKSISYSEPQPMLCPTFALIAGILASFHTASSIFSSVLTTS